MKGMCVDTVRLLNGLRVNILANVSHTNKS